MLCNDLVTALSLRDCDVCASGSYFGLIRTYEIETWQRAGGSLVPLTYTDATGHSADVPNEDARRYVIFCAPLVASRPHGANPAASTRSVRRGRGRSGA